MNHQHSLHRQLKSQTDRLHDQAHNIPYIEQVLKSQVPLVSYIGQLRALAIIQGTLEHQLSALDQPEIKEILKHLSPRLPLILSDLEFLKATEEKDIIPAISEALAVADKIMLYSQTAPYMLLGYVYTLEGSVHGGRILQKHITEAFGLKGGGGITYLSSYGKYFIRFWKGFVNDLDTRITQSAQKEDIAFAARELFIHLMNIYESLLPVDEKNLGHHITRFNPEAGNYPITTNPLEIEAAIKAGITCWNEFPYYEKRYGDRGRRFTVSDAVWLVSLADFPEEIALGQVQWLAHFLAIRGMPTYTMEFQMRSLHAGLSKTAPADGQKYLKLLHAAEALKAQRNDHINDRQLKACNLIFEYHVHAYGVKDPFSLELQRNTGCLLASALADERNGIPGAAGLKDWLTNSEIFPENWIQAVEKTWQEIDGLSHSADIAGA
ncbi:MAG: biliverdin-producing heme oxygenase [Bacteroidales bacterium]